MKLIVILSQAGVLTKNGYLRLDPAVMHVSCNQAGVFLARFGRPEVSNCIEGLEQYSYSYEEAAEQAEDLRRIFALARAGKGDFNNMASVIPRPHALTHSHSQLQLQQQQQQQQQQQMRGVVQGTIGGLNGAGMGGPGHGAMGNGMAGHTHGHTHGAGIGIGLGVGPMGGVVNGGMGVGVQDSGMYVDVGPY